MYLVRVVSCRVVSCHALQEEEARLIAEEEAKEEAARKAVEEEKARKRAKAKEKVCMCVLKRYIIGARCFFVSRRNKKTWRVVVVALFCCEASKQCVQCRPLFCVPGGMRRDVVLYFRRSLLPRCGEVEVRCRPC